MSRIKKDFRAALVAASLASRPTPKRRLGQAPAPPMPALYDRSGALMAEARAIATRDGYPAALRTLELTREAIAKAWGRDAAASEGWVV